MQNNSICKYYLHEPKKIFGDNTDIFGFETPLIDEGFDGKNKQALVLGAGGVSTSVILALKNLGIAKITLMNRTKDKALNIKQIFNDIEVRDWGERINFDLVVNCTSLGLNNEELGINLNDVKGKFFTI